MRSPGTFSHCTMSRFADSLPVTTPSARRAISCISPRYTGYSLVFSARGVNSGCTSGIRSCMLHTHRIACGRRRGNAGSGTMKFVE